MDERSPENTPEPVAMSRSQYVWTLVAIAAVGIGLAWFRGEQAAAPSGEGTVASEPKVAGNGGEAERLVLEFPMMGTRAAVAFYGDREEAENAAKAVRETFLRIQGICNLFDPASELSRLNATAAEKPFVCSEELWEVLTAAREAYEFSEGAFDITAKPLMDLWGFYRKRGDSLPSAAEIAEAKKRIGLNRVVFDDAHRSVRFPVPGMSFDLGGIAKGFAVDKAAEAVLALGVRRGIIDLGGNLRVLPEPPPGRTHYRIAIRDPHGGHAVLERKLEMLDQSVATSGDYERFVVIQGRKYAHIMNVATGEPATGMLAVTVVAPSALRADIYSTTAFIRGEAFIRDKNLKDSEFYFYPDAEAVVKR